MDFQQLQCELLLDRWRNERQLGQPRSACGPTNRISDVAGVRVGHVTLAEGERQTGVTAIVPPGDNLYLTPLPRRPRVQARRPDRAQAPWPCRVAGQPSLRLRADRCRMD